MMKLSVVLVNVVSLRVYVDVVFLVFRVLQVFFSGVLGCVRWCVRVLVRFRVRAVVVNWPFGLVAANVVVHICCPILCSRL